MLVSYVMTAVMNVKSSHHQIFAVKSWTGDTHQLEIQTDEITPEMYIGGGHYQELNHEADSN